VFSGSINAPDPWVDAAAVLGVPDRQLLPLLTLELERRLP
jgi:hypothetical protein